MDGVQYETIFFDLDGTLTESGPGILKSVQYALAKFGIYEEDLSKLRPFIGPPLVYSFSKFYGMSEQDARRAMAYYREYYPEHGIFDNSVYEGIPALLAQLKGAGKRLCVATGKPEVYANKILEHFNLSSYFDVIGGSDFAETRADKTSVIRYVLDQCGLEGPDCGARRDGVVMVGDRHHDIDGAKANSIRSIGILFGYGDRTELEKAGADVICATVSDLQKELLK